MQSQQIAPDQLERLAFLDARITKKPKHEVFESLQKNMNNPTADEEKSDDLKCSQNSENSKENKLFPSRNLSPQKSKVNKKKTPSKEQNFTPQKKKKVNQQRNITDYIENKKKGQKLKKSHQKAKEQVQQLQPLDYEYNIQDSPLMRQLQKSPIQVNSKEEFLVVLGQRDQSIKELKNQFKIQESLNGDLRSALNQIQDQQLRCQDVIKQLVIENEQLKKVQLKYQMDQNKQKLGEYTLVREKTQIIDVWTDGSDLKQAKEQLKKIEAQKQEIEAKKKSLKSNESNEMLKNELQLKLSLLTREEQFYQDHLEKLEIEKNLFIKQIKRSYEEEHARFTKENHWPIIGQRYQILSLLGKGGFSEVYKAFDLIDLKEVACKIHQLNPSWSDHSKQNYIKHAIRENRVHQQLNHQHIVKLFDSVEMDKSSFCTVLELCDGPDLSFYLKKYKLFSEKEAKIIIQQMLSALKYLNTHRNKIIHYDLKPQNILFHQNEVKISDFGLCKVLEDDKTRLELTSQGVGTYWYLPPECFHMGDQPPNISSKVDIWAVGCIFYEMLYGTKPFGQGVSQEKILKDQLILKADTVIFPNKPQVSSECKDFIRSCLQYQQAERIDVIQACSHPYMIKKIN